MQKDKVKEDGRVWDIHDISVAVASNAAGYSLLINGESKREK